MNLLTVKGKLACQIGNLQCIKEDVKNISSFLQFGLIVFLIHFDSQYQPVLRTWYERSLMGWKAGISESLF